jgi:hypothetical protein
VKRRRRPQRRVAKRVRKQYYWKCTELGANKLGIECPFCQGKTVVNKMRWVSIDRLFTTRGCTYCGWFATIPLEQLPARDTRRDVY